MTNIHFTTRRTLTAIACLSLVSMLAACGNPNEGYYNSSGKFIDTSHNGTLQPRPPVMGIAPQNARNESYPERYSDDVRYTRRGYYDYNGYYMAKDSGLNVPVDMFPRRGMCRVWFTDRDMLEQPSVESCEGIKSRVPAGAYVIYGG
jgi:hypothetical protein